MLLLYFLATKGQQTPARDTQRARIFENSLQPTQASNFKWAIFNYKSESDDYLPDLYDFAAPDEANTFQWSNTNVRRYNRNGYTFTHYPRCRSYVGSNELIGTTASTARTVLFRQLINFKPSNHPKYFRTIISPILDNTIYDILDTMNTVYSSQYDAYCLLTYSVQLEITTKVTFVGLQNVEDRSPATKWP